VRQTTENLLQLLAENASASFDAAKSLPPSIYHSSEILELERERLFRKEWICLGRTAEIPKQGDFLCRDIIDAPVFVVRQRDDSVKAFANVCVHRSSRLLSGAGHVSRISCPYHSWTYELDGQLIGAPFMDKTPGFDVANHKLKVLPCETWEGFIYVSLHAEPIPFATRLGALTDLVADFRMPDYVPVFAEEETWDTNWKCLVENFMDAYHLHRVHKHSFGKHGSSEDQTELFAGEEAFTYHYVQEDEGPSSVNAHPDNTWLQGSDRRRTWLISIFPSHVIQLQPDMLWYLSILPIGLDKVNIRWAVSIPAEILDSAEDRQSTIDDMMGLLHQVNSEDRPVVENVFRTTASPDAVQGPLSYLERNVWEFGRYLARNLCE
jgi:phenylpropionate dioxygenase-like ring-hydroxylating dioxygenase large terminal subunit